MSIRDLYQEMILDHGRHPRNFGKIESPDYSHVGHNPLCGDRLIVYVKADHQMIEDIRFEGLGCAISMASASIMTEYLRGKNIQDLPSLLDAFQNLVTTGNVEKIQSEKLKIFGGVSTFPARVKCATLAWHTLKAAIQQHAHQVTTE